MLFRSVLYDITTATDPIMQFIGEAHPALNGNSEHIFVPLADAGSSTGGWRPTTTVSIYDPAPIYLRGLQVEQG